LTSAEHNDGGQPAGPTAVDDRADARVVADQLRGHLDRVDELTNLGLPEHVEFYQRVHGELQSALTDIDSA
jgi:hypothetical protein